MNRPLRVEVPVRGMHCAGCVSTIEKAAKAVSGVRDAAVNLASETASIEAESSLDARQLDRAIRNAGYRLVPRRLLFRLAGPTAPEGIAAAERAWQSLPGVVSVQLNYAAQSAIVETLPGLFDRAALDRAAAGFGWSLEPMEAAADVERDRTGLKAAVAIAGAAILMIVSMDHGLMHRWGWLQLLLALPVQFWSGWEFHEGFFRGLLRRSADMNTLVSLGTNAAFGAGIWGLASGDMLTFDTGAMIIAVTLTGRWLERKARRRSRGAVEALIELAPRNATVERDGREMELPLAEVRPGDVAIVKPGGRVAADGVVVEGTSEIDESMLTGESRPVDKKAGDPVFGGTVNASGALKVRISATGEATVLGQIVRTVQEAQGSKSPAQRLADLWAGRFVPIVLGIALATLGTWLAIDPSQALARTVAVLVVACPCALGLATPVAVVVASGRAARSGILFKSAEIMERMAGLTTVVFDKTGTLTLGRPVVSDVRSAGGRSREDVLRLAAALERKSEHPVARAIVAASPAPPESTDMKARPGLGVVGTVEGREVSVGSLPFLEILGVEMPEGLSKAAAGTIIGVVVDGSVIGLISVTDGLRPESAGVVASMKVMGLAPLLLSGDSKVEAERIAGLVGIATVHAPVMPGDKAEVIQQLQAAGRRVAMVGDGINDAPALAAADVGIALASGSDVAVESAGVVLVQGGLAKIPFAVTLARRARRIMKQNFAWAFGYNALLIPMAAGVLVPWGIPLDPMVAAGAMALSSLTVVANSLRLRR